MSKITSDEKESEVPEKGNKLNSENEIVDYDGLLSSAGEFGRYQILLFLSTFPFYLFGVFVYFSQIFLTQVSPNHWCWVPELDNLTIIQRRNLAIPSDVHSKFGYSRCEVYVANWSYVLETGATPNASWPTEACQNGWEFNKTEIPYPTISSELGWVCDKDSYQATAQAIFFAGSVIGGCAIGWISDRFGRLPGAVISNMIGCLAGIASAFSISFYDFITWRFFNGMASDSCMMIVYLLVLEYVAPQYRTLASSLAFALLYGPSAVILPWIALACGHWKILCLVTSVPMVMSLLIPYILPESPRWLLSKGRIQDAVDKVINIGRVNKKVVSPKLIEKFIDFESRKKEEKCYNILEIFKRPLLLRTFIYMCLLFSCSSLIYDALILNIGQLDFDFFATFSITSSTELPALIMTAFIMDKLGRRCLTAIVLIFGCIFSILSAFLGSISSVVFTVLARFAVNIAFAASIQWGPEILPTPIRATGASMVHIIGHLVTILAPYIVYAQVTVDWAPFVLIACISAIGVIIALLLPETANKELPQTFEDAENLIRNQRIFDMPFIKKTEIKTKQNGQDNKGFELNNL